jgi:hypothetical protein
MKYLKLVVAFTTTLFFWYKLRITVPITKNFYGTTKLVFIIQMDENVVIRNINQTVESKNSKKTTMGSHWLER